MSDTRRAVPVVHFEGTEKEITDYLIFCPACRYGHAFDERWTFNGDFERPTFRASMLVHKDECHPRCHSFVTDGRIEFLSDCTHDMAGQTVDLPPVWGDDE